MDTRSMIGTVFDGRYLLISVVGRGGSSVVFNAYDRKAGCTVAIKIFDESLCAPEERVAFKKQFTLEVRALSSLSHPGIVEFKGANLKKDPMYFAMEYVDGLTLKEYALRKKALSQKEIVAFASQILSALDHIHKNGIVHCDIKPQNVIVLQNGRVKLIDFGISRISGRAPELPPDKAVGTVSYVSPEQAEGKLLDYRSDIYSLGILLYEITTGRLPFVHDDPGRVAEMHTSAPPRRPRSIAPDTSKGMEQIILKAIAKKPHMRFSSADEMKQYVEILKKNPRSVFRLQANSGISSGEIQHADAPYSSLIGVCAALVLTFAVAFPLIFGSVMKGTFGDTVSLSVPDLRGLPYERAIGSLDDRYYDVEIINVYGSNAEDGRVLAQFPRPNTTMEIDPFETQCTISLSISVPPATLKMIDIISLPPEEAAAVLRREGYSVTVKQKFSDTVTKGLCCETFPKAGSETAGGSEVILYVSMGPENNS